MKNKPDKRIESFEEVIKSITEALSLAPGEDVEKIAKDLGMTGIKYVGDSMFEVTIP
jgi:hypothetical protein